jgi:hypothetical protein
MKKTSSSNRDRSEHILLALNKIRKPSTAGEITELLNRDLDQGERPFEEKDIAQWLRNSKDNSVDTLLVKGSSTKVRSSSIPAAILDDAADPGVLAGNSNARANHRRRNVRE